MKWHNPKVHLPDTKDKYSLQVLVLCLPDWIYEEQNQKDLKEWFHVEEYMYIATFYKDVTVVHDNFGFYVRTEVDSLNPSVSYWTYLPSPPSEVKMLLSNLMNDFNAELF